MAFCRALSDSRRASDRDGFSVLETVLALSILSICMVFVLSILPTGVFSLKHAEDLQTASAYGQELIEDARCHPPHLSGIDRQGEVAFNRTVFRYQRSIYQIPPDLVDVRVQLTWNGTEVPMVMGTRLYVPQANPAP